MSTGLFDNAKPSKLWAEKPAATIAPKLDPLASVVTLDMPTEGIMLDYYDHPEKRPKGETTHHPLLDPIFKWVPGWTNLTTAFPNVGKGQFTRELLLLRAVLASKKSLLWVPEDMPREAFYDALVHTLTGQNPDSTSDYKLSRPRYLLAMAWLREKIYVVQLAKGQGKTPSHLLEIFEAARAKLGVEHFALDPWHKLDHTAASSIGAGYLGSQLDLLTTWCSEQQVYLNITINPKRIPRAPSEAWPVPDSDHLNGGAAWDDFAGTTMAFDRPNRHTNRSSPEFAIYTRKIKSYTRADARPGSIGLGSENPDVGVEFNWQTARYMFNGSTPFFCDEVHRIFAPELVGAPAPKPQGDEYTPPMNAFRAGPSVFDAEPPF